jgi:uncharacterized protein (DUF885 family)
MKNLRIVPFLLLVLLAPGLSDCARSTQEPSPIPTFAPPGMGFDTFVDQSSKALLARDPETILTLGLADYLGTPKDQLSDISDSYVRETQRLQTQTLAQLKTFDRNVLTPTQQRTLDIYSWYLQDQVNGQKFMYNAYPVTPMVNGINFSLQYFLTDYAPLQSETDAVNYIELLAEVPTKIEQLNDSLKIRAENGVILPRFLFSWVTPDIQSIALSNPSNNIFYKTFETKLEAIPGLTDARKQELLDEAKNEIVQSVQPAYASLVNALNGLSRTAGNTIGAWSLPDGANYYAYTLQHHTTTNMSVDEIYNLGIQELANIHSRMDTLFTSLGYPTGLTLSEYYQRVANDGGYVSGSAIQTEYERIIRNAEASTAPLFKAKPKIGVIVSEDPTGGFYMPPSMDGSRPGIFYAQTAGSIPRYAMADLAYHEAIPGHHTQIALAGELDIPLFQKLIELNGYTEGWALYAERLMWENGAYTNDPYGELGYLQMQARRAARLVIDTGIHSKKWSFDKAASFMLENTGMTKNDVQGEVGRSIVWPGQECSYYVGYLKIIELRQKMQTTLGANFDIKTFHDLVLGNGPVPLAVLEQEVNDYLTKGQ